MGIGFNETRLIDDASFNAQLGAAHLGELLAERRGSYVLTFAAYNAGPRRVKEWIDAYGDPRKPDVDPIDWIERIPFSETRNYVQRVMENLTIYRARFEEAGPAPFAPIYGRQKPNSDLLAQLSVDANLEAHSQKKNPGAEGRVSICRTFWIRRRAERGDDLRRRLRSTRTAAGSRGRRRCRSPGRTACR